MSLEGYVLVLGAGSGIGRETVYTFAERGITGILCADVNEDRVRETAEASKKLASNPNYRAIPRKVDVSDRESVEDVFKICKEQFGRIDVSVNAAGIGAPSETNIADISTEEFNKVYNVNAKGTFFCTSAAIKIMEAQVEKYVEGRSRRRSIGRGCIVNVAPLNTDTAAAELARKGVRINSVLPSWVYTPVMEKNFSRTPELSAAIKTLAPAGRMAYVEEISESIHFLCTPSASYIHGIGLVVDSGFSHIR